MLVSNHLHPADRWLVAECAAIAKAADIPLVASAIPDHATADDKPLLDVLTAIRHRTTLDQAAAHGLLLPNSEHRLHGEAELRALLPDLPEAFDNAARIAAACEVSLDFSDVRFPGFPVPAGETPFSVLYGLCQESVQRKYHPMTRAVAARLQRELDVIEKTHLAEFFLITWDIMKFAREHGIPGQGRGSAADSIVAYLLGITRVDPVAHDLLFERFLHEDHQGTPDIDIDFSTDHREQVLQYVYEKYGPDRTGMVANVVTFRPRMAIRQVGAAMGFPETVVDKLSTHTDSWYLADVESTLTSAGIGTTHDGTVTNRAWEQFIGVLRRIEGTPRHLSIHVGGMLVTGEPLVDVVPVERATMPGRVVVQFDKDDVEDLGLIKMDLLGLRTLSAIAECLDLIEQTTGQRPDLDELPLDDQRVYDVICKVDTIGLFQIESRAQQQSLWQSQPRCFNDLIVQVAIIRPGPIQGDAVHPYLRRRQGLEPVTYLHPKLEPILAETCGVVLYQEQILRIVMEIAAYTAGEADRFRRAMSRHRSRVEMEELRDGFIRRCLEHDLSEEVAQQIFKSVAGFAEFGFCKSHAAAFARTAYETAWLRMTYPAHYTCALLNAQPMGFYHPSVLVDDVKRHGVKVLPVDVTKSRARCLVEATGPAKFGIRLGFAYVRGLGPSARAACDDAVVAGANTSVAAFWRHTLLPRVAMENLIRVGAFDAVAARKVAPPAALDVEGERGVAAAPKAPESNHRAGRADGHRRRGGDRSSPGQWGGRRQPARRCAAYPARPEQRPGATTRVAPGAAAGPARDGRAHTGEHRVRDQRGEHGAPPGVVHARAAQRARLCAAGEGARHGRRHEDPRGRARDHAPAAIDGSGIPVLHARRRGCPPRPGVPSGGGAAHSRGEPASPAHGRRPAPGGAWAGQRGRGEGDGAHAGR